MGKTEQKTPPKSHAKDIRSFFKKHTGAQGHVNDCLVEDKGEKTIAGAAPSSAGTALKPINQQHTAQPKSAAAKPPTPRVGHKEQKPPPKSPVERDAVLDDDDIVIVQTTANKAKKATASDQRGAAAAGQGRRAQGARPAKKQRVISDDDDEVVLGSSADEDDDDDFEEDVEASDNDSDIVDMVDSDEDGKPSGKKRKQGGQQKARAGQLSGAKHGRSTPAKVAAPTPKISAATPKAAASTPKVTAAVPVPEAKKPAAMGGSSAAAVGSGKKSAKKPPATFSLNPNAEAAIAAVNQAAERLPPENQVNFSLMPEGGEAAGNDATEPPNFRQKDVPHGHPDCLTGRTCVISGVLDSLMRPQAEDLIKRHGGKVTQAVSGRTAFLLVGHNCGRSKYRAAKQHNTKIIDEDGLFALIRASAPFAPAEKPPVSAPAGPLSGPASIPSSGFFGSSGGAGTSGSRPAAGPVRPAAGPSSKAAGSSSGQLWVDKYKPRNSAELVGNNTLVGTLKQWLESWEQVHLHGGSAPAAKGGGSKPKDLTKKAALLSGPPGIGKTSSAHIIARETGFEVVEMNASDTRNKSTKASEGIAGKQSNIIKEMISNTTLPMGQGAGARKQLLIMDEVDGMSGGDRGGIQDLIDNIKRSKIPIICICNDKYNQKLRSLRNYCMELEFRKPTVQQISKRMSEICQKEGLQVNQATLDALVTGAGGDLRLILGQLQMVRLRAQALTYDEVRGKMGTSKDSDMSPFECARRLLEPSCALLSISDRMDLVFADMDLVPLLLQENYVNHRPTIASDPVARLRALAKASDSISAGDVVNNTLRRSQTWGLMPFAAVMSCLLPAAYMRGPRETFGLYPNEMNFPRFTAWLGSYSSGNKQRRLLGELSTTMAASGRVSSSRSAVRLEYASALRHLLARPLAREQEAAVPAVVELMHGYCIDREQLDYILDVTSFKSKAPWAEDPYKEVPTKVKAAFTRSLNSTAPAARCNAQVEEIKLGRGAGKAKAKGRKAAVDDDDEEGALGGDGPEAEQEAKPSQRPPGEGGQAEQEDEEEDLDPVTLARRLAKDGLVVQLQDEGKGTKGKKSGAGGGRGAGGRGAAKASGGGRGGGRGASKAIAKK